MKIGAITDAPQSSSCEVTVHWHLQADVASTARTINSTVAENPLVATFEVCAQTS